MNKPMMLPKLWLEAIQSIWERRVPTSYPATKSEFSLKFDSEEITSAVVEMEQKLNTEESIIKPDMISENTLLGSYLGVYDVKGEENERALIFPVKLSSNVIDVIAMQLNTETFEWERIENTEIVDDYVYATMESFSPIAMFTIKRDTVYFELFEAEDCPAYFANGIPVIVTENTEDDTKIDITDANGKVITAPKKTKVFGGSFDGSDLDTTSVCVKGVNGLFAVVGGSYSDGEHPVRINNIKVLAIDTKFSSSVIGSYPYNKVNNVDIKVTNCTMKFISSGQSYIPKLKKDSNLKNPNLLSNSWVKKSRLDIKNCDITLVYAGGNSGYMYVIDTEAKIDGGKCDYILACGSNGRVDNSIVTATEVESKVIQTVNRGEIKSAKMILTRCNSENVSIAGDPTDKSVDGFAGNIKYDITGGNVTIYVGTNNGKELDIETVNNIVEYVKISRSTNVTYDGNSKVILGDKIRIK